MNKLSWTINWAASGKVIKVGVCLFLFLINNFLVLYPLTLRGAPCIPRYSTMDRSHPANMGLTAIGRTQDEIQPSRR